jgi:transcriptional coactivator HFI1/ADA1
MPEMVDPAALSRPISSTPILPPKTISSISSAQKLSKSSHVPPRIDLEPLYTALKAAIGEQWTTYKESLGLFAMGMFKLCGTKFQLRQTNISWTGHLGQTELSRRIDWFLDSPNGETEHLHNQLVCAIYGNVTREMPDQGVASWVSANDKPAAGAGSKPVSGDAAEQRLKYEVMQLPGKDRRRLKDIAQNEVSLLLLFGKGNFLIKTVSGWIQRFIC